ncbi:hypothetical protein E1B28_007800 [Marasmius oreades]|uniref:Uncharacterized protein n=1 Tax=Marasmius oreades TaxID=181124 RepID=A0A9P7S2X7_9AGAR|nr:uncharacterized protein E1B28_007800 [Marasmius oreades]KAG7094193.1 hypothetical protein E1B28_007800 [Marasmius oreades]
MFTASLDIELLGMLWDRYWARALRQSPHISNRAYAVLKLYDLHQELSRVTMGIPNTGAALPPLFEKENLPKREMIRRKRKPVQFAGGAGLTGVDICRRHCLRNRRFTRRTGASDSTTGVQYPDKNKATEGGLFLYLPIIANITRVPKATDKVNGN